jgi:hypothetical protein
MTLRNIYAPFQAFLLEKPHKYSIGCRELALASARRSRGGTQCLPKPRAHHGYCVLPSFCLVNTLHIGEIGERFFKLLGIAHLHREQHARLAFGALRVHCRDVDALFGKYF